jgi:hypothetical protein
VTDIIESKEGKPLLMLILRGGNKHFLAFKKTEES